MNRQSKYLLRFPRLPLFKDREDRKMETRIAVVGIIVENTDSVESVNAILHQYGEYIIGRMGIPYRRKGVNIVSVAVDAPQDVISALSGKLGRLPGISVKTAYSNVVTKL
jgi:putative iron-only hydrogenase system regulator